MRSMRQLLLLRHAKSSWADAGMADKDRPLNDRGRKAAATMRRAMRELGLVPDIVLVSTAKRTLETLEALEPWDDMPLIEPMESLYLASLPQLITALQGVAETVRSVLLIGHNPGIHELAAELTGPSAEPMAQRLAAGFPTAGLAEFAVPGPWWQIDTGTTRLVRFLTPKGLEAAGQ
jgi:phosphohistidine phosphatase